MSTRRYRGYKIGVVPAEEHRMHSLFSRVQDKEVCCPSCLESFVSEELYREHYREEHAEQREHNDHVRRMQKLRELLIQTINKRYPSIHL